MTNVQQHLDMSDSALVSDSSFVSNSFTQNDNMTGNRMLRDDGTGRLLILASSNLPIGSYTYSQGVEAAIESGLIYDESSCLNFMSDYLDLALCRYELPLLALIIESLSVDNEQLATQLASDYHASRESKEFAFESNQLAISLSAWLDEVLELNVPDSLTMHGFLPLFANVCAHWALKTEQAMITYAFGQIENMVLAAVKTVPLGQMAGQRIIWQLQQLLSSQVAQLADNIKHVFKGYQKQSDQQNNSQREAVAFLFNQLNMSANLPNLASLSCQHESQYSRLFRS